LDFRWRGFSGYARKMRLVCVLLCCLTGCMALPAFAQQDVGAVTQAGGAVTQADGMLSGSVTDADGDLVPGAKVTLIDNASRQQRTTVTGEDGRFHFRGIEGSQFTLGVVAKGLEPASSQAELQEGQALELPPIALKVATASTDVEVTLTREEMAEEDIRMEEKQRLGGVIPNFYVVYDWNAPPLTGLQKYKLAVRTVVDPVNFVIVAGIAGLEQAGNSFPGFAQGASGYGKRVGAGYGDFSIGTMLGGAVLPQLFHQDPRYFYKGTGTVRSRVFYALSTSVIARGDNGRWQPGYANVLGNFASGAISDLYYPASSRNGGALIVENGLVGIASDGLGNLVQEFVLRKLTPGSRKAAATSP
jgi:hypothetical protein